MPGKAAGRCESAGRSGETSYSSYRHGIIDTESFDAESGTGDPDINFPVNGKTDVRALSNCANRRRFAAGVGGGKADPVTASFLCLVEGGVSGAHDVVARDAIGGELGDSDADGHRKGDSGI